jgi:hypothetical protein
VRRGVPAGAEADRDLQRDGEVGGTGHLATDEDLQGLLLLRGHLEHQFVVHLQQDPGDRPSAAIDFSTLSIATLMTSAADPWMVSVKPVCRASSTHAVK